MSDLMGDNRILWGQPVLAKTREGFILGFPRSEWQKEKRMDRLMQWKIKQVKERRMRKIVWWTVFLVSPPLAIAIYVKLWQLAVWAVAG